MSVPICIFAKPPAPGVVKTRLAASVGPVRAAQLATAFLADTLTLVGRAPWAMPVLATTGQRAVPTVFPPALWEWTEVEPAEVQIWLQGDGDLGDRLERVLRFGLEQSGAVMALGADSPGLPASLLDSAHAALAHHDAVLGPTDDGGYYLLGLRSCPAGLLADLPWSQSNTLEATQERLVDFGLTVTLLEPWFDVDVGTDLDRLQDLLQRAVVHADATQALLRSRS